MVKKGTGFGIEKEILERLDQDRGRANRSAHVNFILEILYSHNSQLSKNLEIIRKNEGLRDIPETMEYILKKYIPLELKKVEKN